MSGKPAGATAVIGDDAGVGKRGESGDEKGAFGGLEDSGVTVVDGAIEEGSWKGPGFAVVVGSLEFDPAEGTDMLFPATGANDQKLTVGASGQGWPALIEIWQVADGFCFKEGRGGRGLKLQVEAEGAGKPQSGGVSKKVPSREGHLERMSD